MVTNTVENHPEMIKAHLRRRFGSLLRFERLYRIPASSASAAIRRPHCAAEKAISKALGLPAASIWPDRYSSNGRRLIRQPSENYASARGAGLRGSAQS